MATLRQLQRLYAHLDEAMDLAISYGEDAVAEEIDVALWTLHKRTLQHKDYRPLTHVSGDGAETVMDYDFYYDENGNRR